MNYSKDEFDPAGLLYKALRTHHIKGKVKKYQRIKPEIKYIYRVDEMSETKKHSANMR